MFILHHPGLKLSTLDIKDRSTKHVMADFKLMSKIQLSRRNSDSLCSSSRQRRDVSNLFLQKLIAKIAGLISDKRSIDD